jgi:hypothetical protein
MAARVLAPQSSFDTGAVDAKGLKGTALPQRFSGLPVTSVGDQAGCADGANATLYDDLGFLYFNEGRYADAARNTNALEFHQKNVTIYYDLPPAGGARARRGSGAHLRAGHDDSAIAASIRIAELMALRKETRLRRGLGEIHRRARGEGARDAEGKDPRDGALTSRLFRRSICRT